MSEIADLKAACARRPELLAPAGDWEALRAAVANGADAVYFGLEGFNARRRATNFTCAELPTVLGYLHDRNVKGYVAFNTLVFSEELPQAAEYAVALAEAGADAAIVQDLGLARLIRRLAPSLPLHASTQMTQTEAGGIEWLRELGIRRVIVARELSLAELAQVAQATPMELEVFVHGALCLSYSGQCLASEAWWGRSANRGLCGQACRLPYQLVVDGQTRPLPGRDYLLSPQDLAAYDRVRELVALGIAGFKIEGRLKSAPYVAAATQVYRAAIDAAVAAREFSLSNEQQAGLAQSFSRGFTHGFLDGIDHQRLVQGRFPKSRGLHVGRVVAQAGDGVIVELVESGGAAELLKPGDGVVFDEGHPERDEQGGRIFTVEPAMRAPSRSAGPRRTRERAPVGRRVKLTFGRGDVNLAAIAVGCQVWKTDDPALRRRLTGSYGRDVVVRRIPVHVRAVVDADGRLCVQLRDDEGHEARVAPDDALHAAQKHPLTVDLLREQFARLGGTPFELATIELLGSDGPATSLPWMAPKSVLNDLRRRAVESLLEQRRGHARHQVVEADALDRLRSGIPTDTGGLQPARLHVLVRTPEQLAAALGWSPPDGSVPLTTVYCDYRDIGEYDLAVQQARAAGRAIGLATPRVLMPGEEGLLDHVAGLRPDVVLVRNLGSLCHLRQHAPHVALVGDYSLNVTNEITATVLSEHGLTRLTASYDLNWPQLRQLLTGVPAARLEVVLHQHVPLFHTRHCLFAANVSSGARCGDCGWPCRSHDVQLRDRNGALHTVLPDAGGRNTVFNAAVQSAAELMPAMQAAGLRHFRVELLRETPAQVGELLDLYTQLVARPDRSPAVARRLGALHPAGVTRGTWAHDE